MADAAPPIWFQVEVAAFQRMTLEWSAERAQIVVLVSDAAAGVMARARSHTREMRRLKMVIVIEVLKSI
jgi:hypothetical protein